MRFCKNHQRFLFTLLPRAMTSGNSKKSKFTFPKTMIELGYNFDENGELKKIDKSTGDLTKNPFEFHISDDADHNQKHYEALGEAITNYVYDLLTEEGLDKVRVPPVQPNSDPTLSSFIFTSPDYEKSEKLMVLIHGSGVVRAGQWARSIIINKDLKSGTQLSYIRKAKDEGYGVIVMNTNDNTRDGVRIPGSESPESHAESVWKQCVVSSQARHIAIVAHSYGGVVTAHLISRNWVSSELPLDSSLEESTSSDDVTRISRNWVSSERPLDSPLEESTSSDDVTRVSAGTRKHELTSWTAFPSVFEFFASQLTKRADKSEL
ncbi:FAM172 family protein homolog CG10038-like [Diaphorina citri]|uniref:FAM172 family protein homolog CG10038-like n=1 Tax=Diaphorina citri TaxID=121845 RepID=A0A1S4EHA6_DIACI|nr:FAM172 family protein homolog CG10038-like [Diaphorina citri]